jgi:hypothetical protein
LRAVFVVREPIGDERQQIGKRYAAAPCAEPDDGGDAGVKILEDNASATGIGIGQIFYGPLLSINYSDPTNDPRTPDIIVTPNVGVTYSGSHAKQEEHGGFAHDDTNVMQLLSLPGFSPRTVLAEVSTAQVAPAILQALDLNPAALLAVRVEGTGVLPAVDLK